jgi:ribosomal subunit interface protein
MTQIISKAIHVSMTDSLRSAIEDAFSPILDNFDQLIVEDIAVTVDSKEGQSTEKSIVRVRIPIRGNDIFVEETGSDMYKVIEDTAAKATRQLRKHKEKYSNKGAETIRSHVDGE